jgi:hypothetical protein
MPYHLDTHTTPRPRDRDSSPGEYGSDGDEDHHDRRVRAGSAPVECVPVSARWAVSPRDAKAHSLPLSDHSPVLQTRCGHALPAGVVVHDRLPGWQWCLPCMVAHLMPAPVSARKTPAGRRLNPAPFSVPGGQPVPAPVPRRARCLVDQRGLCGDGNKNRDQGGVS